MNKRNRLDILCESALNEGAGATVTFCFDEKDRDNAGSCDFTFEGTTIKVQNLNIQDYYYGDTAYDGGRIEFNKEEMIDALVKDYTENYGADLSKEKIKDIKIVGVQELPNLHYSWGWVRTKLTGDEVLTWNEYNYGHYLPELQVDVYYTDETMEMLYVNVDGKYYPSEEVVEVYNCLGEEDEEEDFEESFNKIQEDADKYLSDEDIAGQYKNFKVISSDVEESKVHDNWFNATLELEFPNADHSDFDGYRIENLYYNREDDRWGFDNWYPTEVADEIKKLVLDLIDKYEKEHENDIYLDNDYNPETNEVTFTAKTRKGDVVDSITGNSKDEKVRAFYDKYKA